MDRIFSQRPRSLSISEQTSATDDSKNVLPKAPEEANSPRLVQGGNSQERIQGRGKKRDLPDSPPASPPAGKRQRPLLVRMRQSFFHKTPEPAAPTQDCAVPPSHARLAGDLEKIQKELSSVRANLHPNDPQWTGLFTILELAIELCKTASRFELRSDHLMLRQITAQLRQELLASLHTTLNQTLGSFSGSKTSKAKRQGHKIAEKIVALQNGIALNADAPRTADTNAQINSSTRVMTTTDTSQHPDQPQPTPMARSDSLGTLRSAVDNLSGNELKRYAPPPASQDAAIVNSIKQRNVETARKSESARLLQLRERVHTISTRTLTYFSINPDGVPNQPSTEDTSSSDAPEPKNSTFPSFFSAVTADEACSSSASQSDSNEYPLRFPKKRD